MNPKVLCLNQSPLFHGVAVAVEQHPIIKGPHPGREGSFLSIGREWKHKANVAAPDATPAELHDCGIKSILGFWVADFTSQASILYLKIWNTNCYSRVSPKPFPRTSRKEQWAERLQQWHWHELGLSFFIFHPNCLRLSKVNPGKKRNNII